MDRTDEDRAVCPRCGSTDIWFEQVAVPMYNDIPPYPTINGTAHCRRCEEVTPPNAPLTDDELAEMEAAYTDQATPAAQARHADRGWSDVVVLPAGVLPRLIAEVKRLRDYPPQPQP